MAGVFGVAEWAAHSWNVAAGCSHDCRYCYARGMAVRFGRATSETWRDERVMPAKVAKRWRRVEGRIMFPTTHDLTPGLIAPATTALRSMLEPGNDVLVVTKAHLSCVEHLCSELAPWRSQVMWRVTLGTLDAEALRYWEPGAPPPAERLAASSAILRACSAPGCASRCRSTSASSALADAASPLAARFRSATIAPRSS